MIELPTPTTVIIFPTIVATAGFELVYVIPLIHVNVLQADTTSIDTLGWLIVRFNVIVESQPAALGITCVAVLLELV